MADLNIIIADDTPSIRQGLKTVIKENLPYVNILEIFPDGQSAFEYIKNNPEGIDAAILDIQMPYVSGLDIADYVYRQNLPISVIIISGYREFDYAKRAIQSHVFKFICKPVVFQELIQTIEEVREHLISQQANKNRFEKNKRLAVNSCLNVAKLLYDSNDLYGFSTLLDVFMRKDDGDFTITEFLSDSDDDIIDFGNGTYAFLVDKGEDKSVYFAMPDSIEPDSGYEITNVYGSISSCLFCRRVAVAAENFAANIRALNHEAKNASINELIGYLNEDYNAASKIISDLMRKEFELSYNELPDANGSNDPCEFIKRLEDIILASFSDKQMLVENVMQFVKNNFSYDMSLNLAAEQFSVSSGYLSKTFKQVTGTLFIKFLTDVRIQTAMHLIDTTNKSLNDIAREVGYDSNKNFRTNFKKVTGLLPNQYLYMQRRKD